VSSVGSFQHRLGEGLDSQLYDVYAVSFEVVQIFSVYVVGPGGKMYLLNYAVVLVSLGYGKILFLLFKGDSRE
jgi:hypothetical protein